MTNPIIFLLLISMAVYGYAQPLTFHDYKANTITGQKINFSMFYGKKVMVVNTASYCAWTYQYEALQNLYERYQDSNFIILGFPCNDFNNQEPGSDSTINEFCTNEYGVTFQMMSKVTITHDTVDVYKWLMRKSLNGVSDARVLWNFHKFLIDEAGHWVAYYSNLTEPDDPAIIAWIESPSVIPPDTTATGTGMTPSANVTLHNTASSSVDVIFNGSESRHTVIRLFSADGKRASTVFDGMPQPGQVVSVDISTFPSALYFLHVRNEAESKVFRFAVLR